MTMTLHDPDFFAASAIVRRLQQEREDAARAVATPAPQPRPAWDTDSGGVLLKAYRPDGLKSDETVGFLPFNASGPIAPLVYDEPPIGHETGATEIVGVAKPSTQRARWYVRLWRHVQTNLIIIAQSLGM